VQYAFKILMIRKFMQFTLIITLCYARRRFRSQAGEQLDAFLGKLSGDGFARRLSSAFDCLVTFLLASIPTLTQAGWYRADSHWQAAQGLGPPRPAQRGECLALLSTQTVPGASSRRRSPNRAAWRFPDWTAVGFRCDR
jgi:hypothetical protein